MARPYVVFLAGGVVLASLLPKTVQADCTGVNGWNHRSLTFTFPTQIIVQANAPVGTVFYDANTNFSHGGEQFATCPSGTNLTQGVLYLNGWVINSNGVAATNVAGVGVRLYWVIPSREVLVPTTPYSTSTASATQTYTWAPDQPRWRVQLIKTGNITGGTLQSGNWAVFGVGGARITILNIGGGGAITPTGCTLTTPRIAVSLGQRRKSEFTGVGSTTPWQPFDIGLNCNSSARINVRFDATRSASNADGVIDLDPAPGDISASGVGVQIWYRRNGGNAVQFGQETFYAASANGGNETIPLQARYYQTARNITAGSANATATFTLTYK